MHSSRRALSAAVGSAFNDESKLRDDNELFHERSPALVWSTTCDTSFLLANGDLSREKLTGVSSTAYDTTLSSAGDIRSLVHVVHVVITLDFTVGTFCVVALLVEIDETLESNDCFRLSVPIATDSLQSMDTGFIP
jgi:hypothetical protein